MGKQELVAATVNNLEQNNMDTVIAENSGDLKALLTSYIPCGSTVVFGTAADFQNTVAGKHIQTMHDDGVITLLEESDFADQDEYLRKAFTSDYFITRSNAVTRYGYLYNVDDDGNRISAMMFGPKHVIVLVNLEQLVDSKQEAEERVKRSYLKTRLPGPVCNSENRPPDYPVHCCYNFLGKQTKKGRIRVIIMKDDRSMNLPKNLG